MKIQLVRKISASVKNPSHLDIILGIMLTLVAIAFTLPQYVSPETFFVLQLLVPFTFPVYCMVVLISMIFLILKFRISLIITALYLLINVGDFYRTVGVSFSGGSETSDLISVLSYNVSFFKSTQFNPYHKVDSSEIAQSLSIQHTILEQSADVICLQEYYQDENVDVYQLDKQLGPDYQHYFLTRPSYEKGRSGGISVFSKYPILNEGMVLIDSSNSYNGAAFIDILFRQDTIRVINVHLHSMQIKTGGLFSVKSLINVMRSYKRGSIVRQHQVRTICEFIKNSPHKIILTGDLNELSKSYNYRQIANLLEDTFVGVGKGLGYTLNKTDWALFRIDYQFHSEGLFPINFKVLRGNETSDHFPTLATYSLN